MGIRFRSGLAGSAALPRGSTANAFKRAGLRGNQGSRAPAAVQQKLSASRPKMFLFFLVT
jgi:hypothetical protein